MRTYQSRGTTKGRRRQTDLLCFGRHGCCRLEIRRVKTRPPRSGHKTTLGRSSFGHTRVSRFDPRRTGSLVVPLVPGRQERVDREVVGTHYTTDVVTRKLQRDIVYFHKLRNYHVSWSPQDVVVGVLRCGLSRPETLLSRNSNVCTSIEGSSSILLSHFITLDVVLSHAMSVFNTELGRKKTLIDPRPNVGLVSKSREGLPLKGGSHGTTGKNHRPK